MAGLLFGREDTIACFNSQLFAYIEPIRPRFSNDLCMPWAAKVRGKRPLRRVSNTAKTLIYIHNS